MQAAVLRECILNLARIKEAITQNVGGTLEAAGLDAWQELMRGLKAGLLMLGKARAVEVIEGVTGQLKRVMQPGGQGLPPGFMDRLADAIVSVEYYMETLQAGRSDPWYMLDNAQACVQALEQQQTPILPVLPAVEPSAYARTLAISPSVVFGTEGRSELNDGGQLGPPSSTRTSVPPLAETADPELIKLFIEEAHEELAKIKKFFPAWDQNPMERDSLITVRRSFHTLKGSGRMVGARELGEFAWSIENLLNRILDNTLTRTPQIVEVLRDSVNALPELVEQLETGRPPRVDSASISARAHAIAAGKPVPAAASSSGGTTVERTQVIPPAASKGSERSPTVPEQPVSPTITERPAPPPVVPGRPTFAQSVTGTAPAPIVVTPSSPSAGPSSTMRTAALAPPAAADRNSNTQTVVSVHPSDAQARPGSTGFSNADLAEHSLLEEPNAGAAESAPSISESFSSDPFALELNVPELRDAESDVPELADEESVLGAEPSAAELAAGLENLDLLLPEEPAAEESIVLEEEASAADEAPTPFVAATPAAAGTLAAENFAEAAEPVAAEAPAQSGPDDVLRDIYTRETNTHVSTVRAYLDREAGVPEPHAIPEDVYRACHTLSGSSKMAQARHGIRLAEPLDHWLRRVFNSGLGLQNQDMALLADCMVAMEAVVSHLDEVTGYFQNHFGLQDRIAQAEKVLDKRVAQAAEEQAEASLHGDEDELSADGGDFDPEVAAIFTEEAMELIEFSESALSDWRSEPGSAEYRSALKRPLHTLKGGARMAGITAMGDLSHELETLVMQVDNGTVPTDDAMFDVIQASLDELARMREAVANGRRVSSARAMINRIHNLTKPRGAAMAPAPQGFAADPSFATQRVAPPGPQSSAPPPPALTPAEQQPPTAAAREPQAESVSDDESDNAGLDNPLLADAEVANVANAGPGLGGGESADAGSAHAEWANAATADAGASHAEAAGAGFVEATGLGHDESDVAPEAETQLNRALPHSALPDTLIAPLPPFAIEEVGGSNPVTGDLAAELLASYPTTPGQTDAEQAGGEESTDGEAGTYDLSGSDLADLSGEHLSSGAGGLEIPGVSGDLAATEGSGEFAIEGASESDAARADAAAGHIAADYMAAHESAANEEVTPVRTWTPESTQVVPTLDRYGSDAAPLLEDQPYATPAGEDQSAPWDQHGGPASTAGQWADSEAFGGDQSSSGAEAPSAGQPVAAESWADTPPDAVYEPSAPGTTGQGAASPPAVGEPPASEATGQWAAASLTAAYRTVGTVAAGRSSDRR